MKVCATKGCPELVESGHCIARGHRRQVEQQRGTRHQRGYTNQWARRSKDFLSRYPFCGMRPDGQPPVMSQCHDAGLRTVATQTDHVQPHKGDQALFWDERGNWQALCRECGAAKSGAGL